MGSTDRQAGRAAVEQIDINQLVQGLLERRCRIVAGTLRAQRIRIAGMSQRIGSEESRNSVRDRCPVGQSLIEAGKGRVNIPDRVLLHPLPEFFELRKAILDSVARDRLALMAPI